MEVILCPGIMAYGLATLIAGTSNDWFNATMEPHLFEQVNIWVMVEEPPAHTHPMYQCSFLSILLYGYTKKHCALINFFYNFKWNTISRSEKKIKIQKYILLTIENIWHFFVDLKIVFCTIKIVPFLYQTILSHYISLYFIKVVLSDSIFLF